MTIRSLLWDEHNEAHVARHDVTLREVEQLVFAADTMFFVDDRVRRGRLLAFGVVSDRYLVAVLDEPTSAGDAYVVTARPMTRREIHDYQEVRDAEER